MRETNHLRKYANAAGKNMRGPKKSRVTTLPADLICCCGYRLSSHDAKHAEHEFYKREGMCDSFVRAALTRGEVGR